MVFRLMPEGVEDFQKIKEGVEKLNPQRIEEEPIAFGLKAVKATFIVPDEAGHLEKLEEELNSIEKVKEVETVMVSRSL